MTDLDLDDRVAALTDADLARLAAGQRTESRVEEYRPALLLRRLAAEVLRLRGDVADARAVVESLADRVAAQSEVLSRRAEKGGPAP